MKSLNKLQKEVLDISKELELSHIGSNLSVLPILMEIYSKKKDGDFVILDNAHAHLAHLLLMYKEDLVIKKMIEDWGIHCDRRAGCDSSGGSLGHGIGVGIGFALSNLDKTVHIIVSDGSMQEGANWEALRLIKLLKINNIKIYANFNGYTAVDKIDRLELVERARAFCPNINVYYTENGKGFEGVKGHYEKIIL